MLKKIVLQETEDEPWVNLDRKNNIFEIGGRSLTENAVEFFSPILEWISEYVKNPNKSTHFICEIEYFNSSSVRRFYEIFTMLNKIKQTGNEIKISWYYESGDILMQKKGDEFKSILDIPFEVLLMD